MFWRHDLDRTKDAMIQLLQHERKLLQDQLNRERERVDRLTEALARKAGVDLILPMPLPPIEPSVPMHNPWKDPNPVTSVFPRSTAKGAVK